MKTIILTLALSLATTFTFAQIEWKFDTEDIVIEFDYSGEQTKGKFTGLDASINFDPSDLSTANIVANVPTNSITTNNSMRDKHLLAEDFFHADKYPTITFTSTSFEKTKEGYQVTGNLDLRGSKHEEVISFTFENNTFNGKFSIDAEKYGVVKKAKKSPVVDVQLILPVTN